MGVSTAALLVSLLALPPKAGAESVRPVVRRHAVVSAEGDASLTSMKGQATRQEFTCGAKGADQSPMAKGADNSPFIVNGQDATPCEWKWQVSLRSYGRHFCGGTLISSRWVYTAAHCMKSSFTVVVGDFLRTSSTDQWEKEFSIAKVVKHPAYNKQTNDFDIALVELAEDVPTNACVGYACIPDADIPPGSNCYITGWGTLKESGSLPEKLQEAPVNIKSNAECNQGQYAGKITDSMICAQGKFKGKVTDACQGDSGGPLVCEVGGKYSVFGTTSWGYGCARAKLPGIWGRTHFVKDWIITNMGGYPSPTPTPPPPDQPGGSSPWTIQSGSGCAVASSSPSVSCLQSKNYPNNYGINEGCTVAVVAGTSVTKEDFQTEDNYDWLTVDGTKHAGSGPNLPETFQPSSISWTSDSMVAAKGWRLCTVSGSSPTPTPSPTLPGPPGAPGPPGPPGPQGPPGPPR